MLNVAAIVETIETAREKYLPGRESCVVNEAMRSVRMLFTDPNRRRPIWSHRHRDDTRGQQGRHRPGLASK